MRALWPRRGVLSRCLGHQCAPQSSLDFPIPTLGLHHCSLSDPNLPVATHLWLQMCGSRLDLGFFFFFFPSFLSTCVCGAAGTRIDLRFFPTPQRVAFSWATASVLLHAILFTGSERAAPALKGVWGGFNRQFSLPPTPTPCQPA